MVHSISTTFRSALPLLALVAAMLTLASSSSRADCCGFGIANSSNCEFRVAIRTAAGDSVIVVPTGGWSWTVPNCDPFRLVVVDACGVSHTFPTTVGQCIDVYLRPGCCVQICQISECRWAVYQAHCVSCV